MTITTFARQPDALKVFTGDTEIEYVTSHKLLGLTFDSNLKWKQHVGPRSHDTGIKISRYEPVHMIPIYFHAVLVFRSHDAVTITRF